MFDRSTKDVAKIRKTNVDKTIPLNCERFSTVRVTKRFVAKTIAFKNELKTILDDAQFLCIAYVSLNLLISRIKYRESFQKIIFMDTKMKCCFFFGL